jgi:DNA-binding transcriptional ArsR family regulator
MNVRRTQRAAISPALAQSMGQMRQHAGTASQLLKAMGNEQRLLILCQLVGRECNVAELHTGSDLSQSALSQHLAVLRGAGLVSARREGQSVFYALPAGPVRQVMQTLHDIYCREGA